MTPVLAMLLVSSATAALPDWAVHRIEDAYAQAAGPVLMAAGGSDAEALAAEAQAELGREVLVLREPDGLAAMDRLLAEGCHACGILLERSDQGTLSLRRRGECAQPPANGTPEPAEPTLSPTEIQPLLRVEVRHNRMVAFDATHRLDTDAFSWRVGDIDTYRAYQRASLPVKLLSAGLVSSAGLAALGATRFTGHSPRTPSDDPVERTIFFGLAGYAAVAAPGSLVVLAAHKYEINGLDHWYTPEEASAWVTRFDETVSSTGAPPDPTAQRSLSPLLLQPRNEHTWAYDRVGWLNAGEFAKRVGDERVQLAYEAEMGPVKNVTMTLGGSALVAAAWSVSYSMSDHADSTAFSRLRGPELLLIHALIAGPTALIHLGVRKRKLNRLSTWYTDDEILRITTAHNERLQDAEAPTESPE